MGEIAALAAKFGVKALRLILTGHGFFATPLGFFAFMPLGRFTIGVLLVIIGVFVPKRPDHDRAHGIKLGHGQANVDGNAGTVLLAVGALAILGSIFEGARQRPARGLRARRLPAPGAADIGSGSAAKYRP